MGADSQTVFALALVAAFGSSAITACAFKRANKRVTHTPTGTTKPKREAPRRKKQRSNSEAESEHANFHRAAQGANPMPGQSGFDGSFGVPNTPRAPAAYRVPGQFDGSFGPAGTNHGFYGSFGLSASQFGSNLAPNPDTSNKFIDEVVSSVSGRRMNRRAVPGEKNQWKNAGFSMEDARRAAEETREKLSQQTPHEVLADLQRGNTRFWMGCSNSPEVSAFQRRALIMSQFPRVAILGCSDSRVPTEIVFDQSLGDIFVVRVAGNVLDLAASASLEYAIHHLKVKVVIVLGHEGCGAVKAALLPMSHIQKAMPQNLQDMLADIKEGLDGERVAKLRDPRAHDREAVVTNVNRAVDSLVKDKSIMDLVQGGELIVCGAFYEISSGIVDFFKEVSDGS
jgi:carbonic anhydrase